MSRLVACSPRIVVDRQTDRQTNRQTDTQNDYCNPRCACAPRLTIIHSFIIILYFAPCTCLLLSSFLLSSLIKTCIILYHSYSLQTPGTIIIITITHRENLDYIDGFADSPLASPKSSIEQAENVYIPFFQAVVH